MEDHIDLFDTSSCFLFFSGQCLESCDYKLYTTFPFPTLLEVQIGWEARQRVNERKNKAALQEEDAL